MQTKDKARVLVDLQHVSQIEKMLEQNKQMAKQKGTPPDTRLFNTIHRRIYLILKANYLDEFYQKVL